MERPVDTHLALSSSPSLREHCAALIRAVKYLGDAPLPALGQPSVPETVTNLPQFQALGNPQKGQRNEEKSGLGGHR